MHFSIPDTKELPEPSGSGNYTAFNIHVNGVFHCTLRFKQLYNFNEQLRKEFGNQIIPPFPPKKLFALTDHDLEERRVHLEKWIQHISQDHRVQNSHIYTSFFLNAQKETVSEPAKDVSIDVFLMNGHKITVNILSTDQTDTVHEVVCSQVKLDDDYVYYFGLFLLKKEESGDNSIVRQLQDFESPFISLRAANKFGVHRLVLRKSYWDPTMDDDLIDDRVAMNLLYVQAVSDIERGWVVADKEQMQRLSTLQRKSSKKEYLRLSRTLKYYSYLRFRDAVSDYPADDTKITVYAGNRELHFIINEGPNQGKEGVFAVTRMKSWRIISAPSSVSETGPTTYKRMELSIEYLIAKDKLKWVVIKSDQAILISMCLQSMVDELMMKKSGKRVRRPQEKEKMTNSLFMKKDGTFDGQIDESESFGQMALDSVKRLSDRITSLNLMGKPKSQRSNSINNGTSAAEQPNNSTFGRIGDDDL